MTSMLIRVLSFLVSSVLAAAPRVRAWKTPPRISSHPQTPPCQSYPHCSPFGHHSDRPFTSLVSLYLLSRKCTPPQSCLLPPCGHASATQPLFPAGLFIPRESRATSMLCSISHFTVLSPPYNQSCHLNSQHSREWYKVACRDAGTGHCRPRTCKYLHRGTKSV